MGDGWRNVTRPGMLGAGALDGIGVFSSRERDLVPTRAGGLGRGGVRICGTFTTEQGRRVKRPRNPRWLREPGELRDTFDQELEILAYREGQVEEKRWVASLVGRKTGDH